MKIGYIRNDEVRIIDSSADENTFVDFKNSLKITPTEFFNKLYEIKDLEKHKQKEMLTDFVFQSISITSPEIEHYSGPLVGKQGIMRKDIIHKILNYIRRLDYIDLYLRFIRKGTKLFPTTTPSGCDVLSPGEVGVRLDIGFSATKDTNSLSSKIGFRWYHEGERYHQLILPNVLANLRSLHNILSEELKKHYSQFASIGSIFLHQASKYILT